MRAMHLITMLSLMLGFTAIACTEDDPCDPGFIHVKSACVKLPPAPVAPNLDAADDAASPDAMAAKTSELGDPCTSNADCVGANNICINDFSNPMYCTKSCVQGDPSACPATWTCFNAEPFLPGTGQICAKPRK
ncbi:MAG: hypothetical protein SF187_01770 [Deltaproteobacteria bacterium]|nr:hypothetical protein [Deltaproteobacteria bacterium]